MITTISVALTAETYALAKKQYEAGEKGALSQEQKVYWRSKMARLERKWKKVGAEVEVAPKPKRSRVKK